MSSSGRAGDVGLDVLINHTIYADDLVIFSIARFQRKLNIRSVYGVDSHVEYDANKSTVMTCRAKKDKVLHFSDFYLSDFFLL